MALLWYKPKFEILEHIVGTRTEVIKAKDLLFEVRSAIRSTQFIKLYYGVTNLSQVQLDTGSAAENKMDMFLVLVS